MDSICMQGSALGAASGGGLAAGVHRLGPRAAPGGVFGGRAGDGHGAVRRVVMGTSGGTSLCTQSGKHFRELGLGG